MLALAIKFQGLDTDLYQSIERTSTVMNCNRCTTKQIDCLGKGRLSKRILIPKIQNNHYLFSTDPKTSYNVFKSNVTNMPNKV